MTVVSVVTVSVMISCASAYCSEAANPGKLLSSKRFPAWARGSAVEHPLHTRGVDGSIPSAPTIHHFSLTKKLIWPDDSPMQIREWSISASFATRWQRKFPRIH